MPQDVCTKTSNENDIESGVIKYAKSLLQTFVIIIVIFIINGLRKLIKGEFELFSYSIFIIGCTLFLSIVNIVDEEVYRNIMLGLGIALGFGIIGVNPTQPALVV